MQISENKLNGNEILKPPMAAIKDHQQLSQKKDSYYFSHDSNARNDLKIIRLRREMGQEGYGIFFILIEILREQHDYKLPVNTIPDVAYNEKIDEKLINAVLSDYGLFKNDGQCFFSERLLRSMDEYNSKKQKLSDAGKKGSQIKYGQPTATLQPPDTNPIALKKRKENKENKEKEINNTLSEAAKKKIEIKTKYVELIASLEDKDPVDWWNKLKEFIFIDKPEFADPYIQIWNLFSTKYSLPTVSKTTSPRENKIKARLSQSDFDFIKILEKIKVSTHLKGEGNAGWRVTFDWIIENDKNYLKIIEGHYA
jgi:hypothetical protein